MKQKKQANPVFLILFLIVLIIVLIYAAFSLSLRITDEDGLYHYGEIDPVTVASDDTVASHMNIDFPQWLETEEETTAPPEDEPSPDQYDFSKPVPENTPVTDDYFSDAVFIGDSRTVGMSMYGQLKSTYYAKTSLTIFSVFSQAFVKDGEEEITAIDAVKKHPDYKKVYIAFGVNELGYDPNLFINNYKMLVNQIREIMPDATIYVLSVFPVTDHVCKTSQFGVNNERVRIFNAAIQKMAEANHLYYIDTYNLLVDENGNLPDGVSSDGIHLGPGQYSLMISDYLRSHTVK